VSRISVDVINGNYLKALSLPVAARSKAWVCGPSLAGFEGSNPAGGIDVPCECRVCLSGREIRATDRFLVQRSPAEYGCV